MSDAPSTDHEDRIARPHTPGPWTQAHRHCTDGMHRTQVFALANPDEEIATIHWYPVEVAPGHIATNREANARLIATAPELLEALDGLLNALPSATTHPAIKRARAAIRKATGADQ